MYRSLAGALAADRAVTVLTWRGPGAGPVLPPPGVQVVRTRALVPWDRDRPTALGMANTAVSVVGAAVTALRLRRRWRRVHAAGLNPEGLVAALAARALRRPYSVGAWLPGELGNVARLERSPFRRLHMSLLGQTDFCLAENAEIEQELVGAGFSSGRIAIIPAGVSTERFAPAREERRLLARRRLGLDGSGGIVVSCGRFDLRQKRQDVLLEAWRLARPEGWRLVLIGDGPDREHIEALAGGIHPQPILAGWQDDIRPYLAAADLFAFPTNFEGTGLALMEALASGLPAIVSDRPPFARLRPAGAVLVPNDPRAWADALSGLMSDEPARRRLAGQGRGWVETSFDEHRFHDAMRSLLSSPHRSRGPHVRQER